MARPHFPHIRLRVGITGTFLLVVLPLTIGMVGMLYRQNARLAFDMAESAMARSSENVMVNIRGLMDPVERAVELSVAFGKAQGELIRRPESLRPLLDELEHLPDLYSLYFGFARDGGFYQVVRLSETNRTFGPWKHPVPKEARWALRILDESSGEKADSYIYLARWGEVVGVERGPVRYDPRKRPWYEAATRTKGVATSGVYIFSGTGRPGLTLSRDLATDDGERLGVFGADISIDRLSNFLAKQRTGDGGLVFILDGDQRLIGYPDPEKTVVVTNNAATVIKGTEVADSVPADAIRQWVAGAGDHFRAKLGAQGEPFLVSFTPLTIDESTHWTVGVVAPESAFVGPLKTASLIILLAGVAFVFVATLTIIWLSHHLVRPIHTLIRETELIRGLDLDSPVNVRSGVTELEALAQAFDMMKTVLRSFGSYVPKALVRSIVESGAGTKLGGNRGPVTVFFSDISGFSQKAETMAPEEVMLRLSDYLEAMSFTIHHHGGVVDKFVGDAVMALWNVPTPLDDHPYHACCAMLACRAAVETLPPGPFSGLRTRIGLHTGAAVVGNVGAQDRMQYTALGTTVNVASRVEQINKHFGTELLVTGAVAAAVGERVLLRPLGSVVPAGMREPVALLELMGLAQDCPDTLAELRASAEAHTLCQRWGEILPMIAERQWLHAVAALRSFVADYPTDGPAQMQLARCRSYLVAPPPESWDGVLWFDKK